MAWMNNHIPIEIMHGIIDRFSWAWVSDHILYALSQWETALHGNAVSHWLGALTLSQCTLAGPVYTGMPLECNWLTQCTLGYHWAIQRIFAGYTGTPLEKLSCMKQPHTGIPLEKISWIRPTLGCHWRNSNFCSLYWNTTGVTVTAHTRPDTFS